MAQLNLRNKKFFFESRLNEIVTLTVKACLISVKTCTNKRLRVTTFYYAAVFLFLLKTSLASVYKSSKRLRLVL